MWFLYTKRKKELITTDQVSNPPILSKYLKGACFLKAFCQNNNVQKQPPRGVLKKRCSDICSKFTGEVPCPSVISIKLQSNFIEIKLRHGCSPVNLLHIFRISFPRKTSEWLFLNVACEKAVVWNSVFWLV